MNDMKHVFIQALSIVDVAGYILKAQHAPIFVGSCRPPDCVHHLPLRFAVIAQDNLHPNASSYI